MRASKGFWVWIGVAIAALLIGLFIANYSDLKSGYENVKNDVQTQIEQVVDQEQDATDDEAKDTISPNPDTEQEVVEGE